MKDENPLQQRKFSATARDFALSSCHYSVEKKTSSNGLEKRPKLRFPGFDEPWKSALLSDYFAKNIKKNADGAITNVICNSAKQGLIPQRDYFDKDIANSDNTGGYYIIETNDFVYNPRKSTDAPYGPISSYKYPEAGIVSPLYLCFRAKQEINPLYFEWYFRSSAWHRYIYMSGDSGARHDRVSIKDDTFFAMPINIPTAQEQDRIALFLNVIEQRIDKQRSLVESLKKYKRGAIAHILSGKDSEFAGEAIWAEKTLSDLCCEFRSGRSISATLIHESGDYPVYGGNGIRGYCDHYSHEGEYVVVGRQGALCGNVRLIRGQNYLSEHAIAVRANEENDTKFLLYLLDFMNLGQYSDQGAQPGLAVNKLLRLKCNVPEKKIQSKISAFLLTYDKQIAFQESILSLLTVQRKAFLQQLFI